MDDKKREVAISRAKEIFTYCMESDDPRLDEVVWIETLPLRYSMAQKLHQLSEPYTVRKAILATLFDFPDCINADYTIRDDYGIEYYEGKSQFISFTDCTDKQQEQMQTFKSTLKDLSDQMGDSIVTGQKGNVTFKVNLWLDIDDINFDNITEWLNFYCKKNVYTPGMRLTELICAPVSKEALSRAGIEISDFRWRKIVDENDRIGSRDVVEAVQMKEIPENVSNNFSFGDVFQRINNFFYQKRRERNQEKYGRKFEKRQAMLERDRWDHRI